MSGTDLALAALLVAASLVGIGYILVRIAERALEDEGRG